MSVLAWCYRTDYKLDLALKYRLEFDECKRTQIAAKQLLGAL